MSALGTANFAGENQLLSDVLADDLRRKIEVPASTLSPPFRKTKLMLACSPAGDPRPTRGSHCTDYGTVDFRHCRQRDVIRHASVSLVVHSSSRTRCSILPHWLSAVRSSPSTEINRGRLYPNLDMLVEKGQQDRRTNYYALTRRGRRELEARREWENQYIDV